MDLKEDYKGNEMLYAVMRNKMKPKTELNSILNTVGLNKRYIMTRREYLKDLLNVQNNGEGSTKNKRVPENQIR
jgi:hypothetical protein